LQSKYVDWIRKYVDGAGSGLCEEYALLMEEAFPELTSVWGSYSLNGKIWHHVWCSTPEGERVDPTADQFESGGSYYAYTKWVDISRALRAQALAAAELITGKKAEGGNVHVAHTALRIIRNYRRLLLDES
jgi:hypothetical protein